MEVPSRNEKSVLYDAVANIDGVSTDNTTMNMTIGVSDMLPDDNTDRQGIC